MPASNDSILREEIAELGAMLGRTIQDFAGPEHYQRVETIRQLARDFRHGDRQANSKLAELLKTLEAEEIRIVIRAFTMFLDLANLAEDRQRLRVLRERARAAYPAPMRESVQDAFQRLKDAGLAAEQVRELLHRIRITLVFTAHPTEAKRRSIRNKLRRLRALLAERDAGLLPHELERNRELQQAELAKWWLTDFIRPWRPTVLQEVKRGLSMKSVLWEVTPDATDDLRRALAAVYGESNAEVRPCVSLGSWIGGDRDGHPYVTTDVTRQTLSWLRSAALEFHVQACNQLFDSLSLSKRQLYLNEDLDLRVAADLRRWAPLRDELAEIPPTEVFRRWLRVIRWRLRQTLQTTLEAPAREGAYSCAGELEQDVSRLHRTLQSAQHGERIVADVARWWDRTRIFGLQLARLDIRQDARLYASIIDELATQAGLHENPSELREEERQQLLLESWSKTLKFNPPGLSEEARETLQLFRLLHEAVAVFGPEALGGHVISMTHAPSDLLSVLWLWRHTRPARSGDEEIPLPVIPLFETITDLQNADAILAGVLQIPVYRDYLQSQGNRQIVMLGYSDSTKDGGYLSACWSLYRCQQQLHETARRHGIHLTFFHGRGGSLGRGGGPAARSILSLPSQTFDGSLRLTEQGEVLAERYDDPRIAHRHLEQVLWSSLLAVGLPAAEIPGEWRREMNSLAERSFAHYRELVEQPGFVEFFRLATPVSEVEQLPIGSRPARRRGGGGLSDLRAIPWVFSWTQARCLVPAWYGVGAAMTPVLEDPQELARMRAMYERWPFFRATIDNAELALAKSDLGIAERYAQLARDSEALTRIGTMISEEFRAARRAVLAITEQQELLDGTPWLKESIRVRNRYIDPLNLIQVELLGRMRQLKSEDSPEAEELRHLARLTVKGLAAGMRTTG